jgi:transposase-like protein
VELGDLAAVEVAQEALKAYLDRKLGADGRMTAFSYEFAARLLRRLGFSNLQEIDDAITGYDDDRSVGCSTTLQSTNAIESMISILRRTSRNVKRWQSGDMCLRWTAAGMLEGEQQFRRIIGYSDLAKLALAVEHDVAASRSSTTLPATAEPAATLVTV